MPIDVFPIPTRNLARFLAALDGINRRAGKLGVPPLDVAVGDEELRDYEVTRRVFGPRGWEEEHIIERHPTSLVKVSGEPPRIDGWTLMGVAAIVDRPVKGASTTMRDLWVDGAAAIEDRHEDEVRAAVTEALDDRARICCAHCHTVRNRRLAFVVEHKDGKRAVVGSDCVRDFCGHDPAILMRYFNFIRVASQEVMRTAEAEQWSLRNATDWDSFVAAQRARERRVEPIRYMAAVAESVRRDGWRASDTGRAGAPPTWVRALSIADEGNWTPTESDLASARAACLWTRDMGYRADDLWRLKREAPGWASGIATISEDDTCSAAALVMAYARAEGVALAGEFVGVQGERMPMALRAVRLDWERRGFRDRWGRDLSSDVAILDLVDSEGRRYRWDTTSPPDALDDGSAFFDCRVTIKGHDVDNQGRAVTLLTRVSVGRRAPAPAPGGDHAP